MFLLPSTWRRIYLLPILLGGVALLGAAAPAQQPRGKISGRVLGPDGKAAAESRVTLREINRNQMLMAITDENGAFNFTRLGPGLYEPSAAKSGLVTRSALQKESKDPAEDAPLRIERDTELTGITLHLEKGGVITGRISMEGGDPVVLGNVEVTDAEGKYVRVRDVRQPAFVTDDRGVYRIFGLPPGKYLIKIDLTRSAERQQSFTSFYYPGVGSQRQALAVEVALGQEIKDIDFTVKRARESQGSITGRLARTDGTPIQQAAVWAQTDEGLSLRVSAAVREDGSFEFNDLPAGNFTLDVLTADPKLVERTRSKVFVSPAQPATVNLTVESGSVVAGTFEMDDGSSPKEAATFSITAMNENSGLQIPGRVYPDGRFIIARLPAGEIKISPYAGPGALRVIKMMDSQGELPDGQLSVTSGAQLQNIRVILSDQGGTLHGMIRQTKGDQVAGGAWVSVIPVEGDRRPMVGNTRSVRADQRGAFEIVGIAPGKYFVLAYKDARSLPPTPAGFDAWVIERRQKVPVIEVKSKAQEEISLRILD